MLAEDTWTKVVCIRPMTVATDSACCIFKIVAKPDAACDQVVDIEDIVPQRFATNGSQPKIMAT